MPLRAMPCMGVPLVDLERDTYKAGGGSGMMLPAGASGIDMKSLPLFMIKLSEECTYMTIISKP